MTKKRKTSNPKSSPSLSFTRRRALFVLGAAAVVGAGGSLLMTPSPTEAEEVFVYKDPSCVCCGRWIDHMRQNGFSVTVSDVDDMTPIKFKMGVPEAMESCHTAQIGDYVVEGHVPADDIKRMLRERPAIKGLTVPGMPMSAPGMDSPDNEPYAVLAFETTGRSRVYASY
jgi:hypothetical protein